MYLLRATALIAFALTCASAGFGQKYCTVAPPSPFHHSASIVTRYDGRAKRMRTVMEYPQLDPSNGVRFTLAASFYHQDMRLPTPPSVDLTFIFISPESSSSHARPLSLFLNGRPWSPAANPSVQYSSAKDHKFVIERAKVTLTYESLLQLINSRRIDARLGSSTYQLSEDNLEALRDLARQLAPYSPQAKQKGTQGPWRY